MIRTARAVLSSGLALFILLPPLAASGAAKQAAPDSRKPDIPELKIETYTLPNGLTVILHEDHKTPVVSVNFLYKVGSKDEKSGRTGFAHLFEHMMFQGSKNHDTDYFLPLEKLGAELNGETSEDETVYYETVPSNALELALWLEADRMGFLPPAMTQQKLDNQRDVVKNSAGNRSTMYPTVRPKSSCSRPSIRPSIPTITVSSARWPICRRPGSTTWRRFSGLTTSRTTPSFASRATFSLHKRRSGSRSISVLSHEAPRSSRPRGASRLCRPRSDMNTTDAVSLPRAQLIWPTVFAGHPDEPRSTCWPRSWVSFPRKIACSEP